MTSLATHLQFAKRLTTLMDMKFKVLGIRFGMDPLLDIIPGFGNMLATAISCYLFYIAYRLRVPAAVYIRMLWNIFLDFAAGAIPYIGILFDVLYHSNVRNFALIEKFFDPDILIGEIVKE